MPRKIAFNINQYADLLQDQIRKGKLRQVIREIQGLTKQEAIAVTAHVLLRLVENEQEQFARAAEESLPSRLDEAIIMA
jgi:hypothetical protein